MLELLEQFTQTSGRRAEASFGNMKQVETQVQQNPAIAVVIGDEVFLRPMGLFDRFLPLGEGKAMLVAAKGTPLSAVTDLKDARFRRIALPNRNNAVYGRAAATCLEREGLTASVADRLLEVATVPQVGTYVATGEVDAGFVNKTEAQSLQGRAGTALELPASCYDPIRISAAVVQARGDAPPVQAFLAFLGSPAARAVLQRHGL